jgi:hypothetical protein
MRHAKPNEVRFCLALYEIGVAIKILSFLVGRPPQTIARWRRQNGVLGRKCALTSRTRD